MALNRQRLWPPLQVCLGQHALTEAIIDAKLAAQYGLFLLAQGLAAAYALRVVGRDVDRLQRYTQTDDLFAQLKTELARLPGFELVRDHPGIAALLAR